MTNIETDPEEFFDPELAELETLSNGVLNRIENGLLDEAERMCLELKARFPDMIDWIERSAALHEARGHVDKAVEHYRLCLAYIDRHPDDFDEESREWYQGRIDRMTLADERRQVTLPTTSACVSVRATSTAKPIARTPA